MLRRVFGLASIASIALALAGATLWARGYRAEDAFGIVGESPGTGPPYVVSFDVRSSWGIVEGLVQQGDWPCRIGGSRVSYGRAAPPGELFFRPPHPTPAQRLGFRVLDGGNPLFGGVAARRGTRTIIDLPDWAIVGGGLILPACRLVRRMRRRRVGGFEVVRNGEPPGGKEGTAASSGMGHLS